VVPWLEIVSSIDRVYVTNGLEKPNFHHFDATKLSSNWHGVKDGALALAKPFTGKSE
jgi:hypothetical protein